MFPSQKEYAQAFLAVLAVNPQGLTRKQFLVALAEKLVLGDLINEQTATRPRHQSHFRWARYFYAKSCPELIDISGKPRERVYKLSPEGNGFYAQGDCYSKIGMLWDQLNKTKKKSDVLPGMLTLEIKSLIETYGSEKLKTVLELVS